MKADVGEKEAIKVRSLRKENIENWIMEASNAQFYVLCNETNNGSHLIKALAAGMNIMDLLKLKGAPEANE